MILPSEFIHSVLPGSNHQFTPGSVVAYNDDYKSTSYMTAENFEACVSRHYEYTKKVCFDEEYYTLGERKV